MSSPTQKTPRHAVPARPLRIALLGAPGAADLAGGYHDTIGEIGHRLAEQGHDVTLYLRRSDASQAPEHRGMNLVTLPAVVPKALEQFAHAALSTAHLLGSSRHDVAFVFNTADAPLIPLLRSRGTAVAVHASGLEWQRAKWGRWGRRYLWKAEAWEPQPAQEPGEFVLTASQPWEQRPALESQAVPESASTAVPSPGSLRAEPRPEAAPAGRVRSRYWQPSVRWPSCLPSGRPRAVRQSWRSLRGLRAAGMRAAENGEGMWSQSVVNLEGIFQTHQSYAGLGLLRHAPRAGPGEFHV